MESEVSRREALVRTGLAAVGAVSLGRSAAQAQAPGHEGIAATQPGTRLSAYPCDRNIWVRINDAVFCCYRANSDQKYPYFYPLVGPLTGLGVTEESSVPWPHHRSLFFGCDRVNGGNYWQDVLERGRIMSRGPKIESDTPSAVVLTDVCDWRSGEGQDIIEDRRSYRMTAPDPTTRILDCRITLVARTDIEVTKTNHSLFAIRAARELSPLGGGTLLNAAGHSGEKATFGQPSAWCGFQGTRLGRTESLVLMDHPANPWFPCRWFTRDYGFASPTPFNFIEAPWRLPQGESLTLRYRVAVLGGPIEPATLVQLHKQMPDA